MFFVAFQTSPEKGLKIRFPAELFIRRQSRPRNAMQAQRHPLPHSLPLQSEEIQRFMETVERPDMVR